MFVFDCNRSPYVYWRQIYLQLQFLDPKMHTFLSETIYNFIPYHKQSALFFFLQLYKSILLLVLLLYANNHLLFKNPMNDFPIDFRDIDNQDSALTIVQVFSEMALDQKGLKLAFANDFFTHCLNNLENPSASPKTKFYTMLMLKELSLKDKLTLKLFGHLSKHPLYAHIEQMALKIDPKKAVQQKGKTLFPSDKATGNNLIRLILQSLLNWGTRFASNKDKKPTRFRQTLDRLNDQKVVLPKNLIFYPNNPKKGQTPGAGTAVETKKEEVKRPTTNETITKQQISQPKLKDSKEKYAAQIKFMFNKIEALLSILQDTDQPDQIQREVASYHQKFTKDLQKMQTLEGEMLEGQSQEILHLYFKVADFFSEERGLFNLNAQQNDYASYITGYKIAFQKIFQQSTLKKPSTTFKQQPSIQAKIKEANKPQPASRPKSNVPPPPKQAEKKTSQLDRDKENGTKKSQIKGVERQNSRMAQASRLVEVCYSKLDRASRSPNTGFGAVASSLSRQKQSGLAVRKKNPMAISNFNKSRFGASSMSKSTVNLKGIFANPPNTHLKFRNYEGELVIQNRELEKTSEFILKLQGHRRHKMSHFKSKYILFEDQRIQIGYKATQIYEKVQKFASMLLFELFFGNKTSKTMRRVTLNFQGDKESLIYTSPQTIDQTISAASQFKLELLNIPTSIPFGQITIQLSYEIDGETNHVSAYMPNSILQMVSYYDIQKSRYAQMWGECVKILKTQPFQLSHHFPPDQLKAYIPSLRQNTNYSDFSREGSTTDYELYVDVVIQQSFEGMLKINIRPDLSVVLQAGLIQNEQNCLKNFRFYLQSLAMVLKQQN